ncbi:methyltransferase domain-containing protein [Dongia sedimenti]|uniref:Methyltransferase domain-containing protein n=1 Tax=Dongia sedimenti TaxID=3064282 RepID=A0ABU0YKJ4_9PROT|nr:methyltransferase domain-containing protein [Rhodospirillaceae bacterium R-7]
MSAEASAAHEEYDARMLTLLQIIWGEGFLSPGGPQAVRAIVEGLDLRDKTVLDIGCGIGGLDEVLAGECGARVVGLDVAKLIVQLGQARIARSPLRDRIEIRLTEPGPLPFADASFDVVFGKDAWLHIPDKAGFFAEVFRVLKPGGIVTCGDWMKSPGPYSRDMEYFFKMEGLTYNLVTLAEYGQLVHGAGFGDVTLEDITARNAKDAQDELARMKGPLHDTLTQALGAEARDFFIEDWRSLTVVLDKGELRPARMRARKPR